MKRNLFFDIQLGASGDMLIGSLLDMGADLSKLSGMLNDLKLSNWNISPQKINKYNIAGTSANVICKDHTHHRNLNDIKKIVETSGLPANISMNINKIFENLAAAEGKVHGKLPDEIHFHEVGAVDSIIDISAFCILINMLGIDQIYYNEFPLGTGIIKSSHGEIPVPVPAVVELIKNHKSRQCDKQGELITPTAAAILTTLGKQINSSAVTIIASGIGFGTRELASPSYTRVFLTESWAAQDDISEEIQQIECNIDDMNPQIYPWIIQTLFDEGALDAYFYPVTMKKGRPGIMVTVIAETHKMPSIKEIIYSNTTTLGLRSFNVNREKLSRGYNSVFVFNEEIKIKIGYLNNRIINIHPEFEDCKKASEKLKIPLKQIMQEAVCQFKAINKEKF